MVMENNKHGLQRW